MRCKFKTMTFLSGILLPALLLIHATVAQTISDTVKRANSYGDQGYWQTGQPDVMILWPQDQQNIVKRFTGGAKHPYPYRLWVAPGRAGGFPVVLKNASTFNNFLEHIKASPDKDWCQFAETWSNWHGNPPTVCGAHSYTERRACSIATDALKPCPDLCKPAIQTRARTIDNGPCKPLQPPGKKCSISAWAPATTTVCAGQSFTQTRTLADCSSDRRTVSGTRSCPSNCTPTSWTPSANSVCSGKAFTQTRTLGNCSTGSRSATGTKYCPPSCNTTSWSPATGTVCSGKQFTQTRRLSDCSTGSRTATGTKSCPRDCAVTGWQPSAGTVCAGSNFTQTRTLKNCSTDRRSARGTKCCGTATGWSPDPAGKCGTFTQTRTNACGKTESRTAKGTASWCGCSWGPYTPSPGTVCKGKTFTQKSYYSCAGRTNKPRTRTATGTKSCQKAECSNGQSYCSAYTRYLCRNGKWEVIAQGPYACFTP